MSLFSSFSDQVPFLWTVRVGSENIRSRCQTRGFPLFFGASTPEAGCFDSWERLVLWRGTIRLNCLPASTTWSATGET